MQNKTHKCMSVLRTEHKKLTNKNQKPNGCRQWICKAFIKCLYTFDHYLLATRVVGHTCFLVYALHMDVTDNIHKNNIRLKKEMPTYIYIYIYIYSPLMCHRDLWIENNIFISPLKKLLFSPTQSEWVWSMTAISVSMSDDRQTGRTPTRPKYNPLPARCLGNPPSLATSG